MLSDFSGLVLVFFNRPQVGRGRSVSEVARVAINYDIDGGGGGGAGWRKLFPFSLDIETY